MEASIQGFSTEDSQYSYFNSVRAAGTAADGEIEIRLHKIGDRIIGHLSPSNPDFRADIIRNILAAHRLIGLKCIFSKSLSVSKTISFEVLL